MLFNIEKKEIFSQAQCLTCSHYNKKLKKCEGLNKVCFEYDEKTKTIIDGVTKLPLKTN